MSSPHERHACVDEKTKTRFRPHPTIPPVNNGMKILKLMSRRRLFVYALIFIFPKSVLLRARARVCMCCVLVGETSWRATAVFVARPTFFFVHHVTAEINYTTITK